MGERWLPTMPLPVSDWMADPRIRLLTPAQRGDLIDMLASSWMLDEETAEHPHVVEYPDEVQVAYRRLWSDLLAARDRSRELYRQKVAQTAAAREARLKRLAGQQGLLQTPSQSRSDVRTQSVTSTSTSSPIGEEVSGRIAASMEAFEAFWIAYPPREGVRTGKQAARTAWRHVAESDLPALMAALERLKRTKQWTRDDGKFIPHASTFLNQRRWEDDPAPAPAKGGRDFSSWEKRA